MATCFKCGFHFLNGEKAHKAYGNATDYLLVRSLKHHEEMAKILAKGEQKQQEDGAWAEAAQGAVPLNPSVLHKRAELHTEVAFAFESRVSFLTDSDRSRAEVGPGFVHGAGSHRASHMLPCNNMLCSERRCCNCFSEGS